ncbi:uncharacterized protein LOC132185335 [Corylus avellana]|uniref:uncharacterized protein LOC132185335 n=1 Tax=Corylus avellana TaxID=13451 RepID=UPI00286BC3A2|nr:uncharacterized protein LOC132185335 [Corylus avellana]
MYQEANMAALYEASRDGCISTLTTLIQRDARILDRVSLTSFSETPLHSSTLHGHLEFSKILVSKKPKFAEEVDPLGQTPLHLASAEGHTEIVQALLQTNINACLARDQDGRIPLHLATMRGRIEIIEKLIKARQESILMNLEGDSVLHLCIRYNHLDALKLLVELANGNESFLSSIDHDGNSILHLAVMLKQKQAIKYVLSFSKIGEANAMKKIGLTALDVLEAYVYPRDVKWFEIQNILKEAGVRRSTNRNPSLSPTLSSNGVDEAQPSQSRFRGWWECTRSSLVKHLTHEENWIQETRGMLMVVATVIATMAFQAGISPPGGVWQENRTTPMRGFNCTVDNICKAGTAVLSYNDQDHDDYQLFLSYNTASFFASVSVILLVISGFPLRNKFFIWLLTVALTISVCFMTLSYNRAITFVTPMDISGTSATVWITFADIWQGVIAFVSLVLIIRLLSWIDKKLLEFICKY